MNKFLLILLLCFPLALTANEKKDNTDPKYLKNAITMVDGKVTFKQTLEAPSLSKEQLYNLLLNWSDQYFKPNEKLPQHRVVYTNQDKGEIVAMGEEYIVFSSSALSLDRTRIYYQL